MDACNEVGTLATQEALAQFDTDDSALNAEICPANLA